MPEIKIVEIRRAAVLESIAQSRSLFLNALMSKPADLTQSTDALAVRCLVGGMYEFVDADGDALNYPVLALLWADDAAWRVTSYWFDADPNVTVEARDGQIVCPELDGAQGVDAICAAYIRKYSDQILEEVNRRDLTYLARNTRWFYSQEYDQSDDEGQSFAHMLAAAALSGASRPGAMIVCVGGLSNDSDGSDDSDDGDAADSDTSGGNEGGDAS